MGKLEALLAGTALSLGLGAGYYLFSRKTTSLTPSQLLELAKEKVRQEQETKRTLLLTGMKCVAVTIGVLYTYGQIRFLFSGKTKGIHNDSHHHHHK